ncbi:ABC transporter permease [soil metagenome]
MYKFKLCLRYLRTRYLAFICIVSVMLGVATLIVVNSVMSGFSNKLKDRLLGTTADITVGTEYFRGFDDHPDAMTDRMMRSAPGQYIEAIAPNVEVGGMVSFQFRGRDIMKPVKIMGIDPARQVKVGRFGEYLVNQKDAPLPSFELSPKVLAKFKQNVLMEPAAPPRPFALDANAGGDFLGAGPKPMGIDPTAVAVPAPDMPIVEAAKPIGIIVGDMLAHWRHKDPNTGAPIENTALEIGDLVTIATMSADDMRPVYNTYVVVDYFKSEMSEYDSQFVYLPLEEIQRLRRMGQRANSLQIKLKNDIDKSYQFVKPKVANELQKLYGPQSATYVLTWQDTQGPLLAAIDIERGILNLLLFMIVGVAGFSILAIFTMIVSEKYRDIGILKSLGASNRGVLGIFVWYAIFLGIVGCTGGTLVGLGITNNINEIEMFITEATGQQLFDRSVYYFDKIPTNVENMTVILVNAGAMFVAVMSSLIPAVRAARLRPIQALRFE